MRYYQEGCLKGFVIGQLKKRNLLDISWAKVRDAALSNTPKCLGFGIMFFYNCFIHIGLVLWSYDVFIRIGAVQEGR